MGILALHSKNHQSSSVPFGTVAEIPEISYFWVPKNIRNAHLTQLSKRRVLRPTCCSNLTSANQNSLTNNIQATFKTKPIRTKHKKKVHPLHPLHPITFFRISNWSVATPKMPVPLFYSHTWDALINRSSKPYINKSSPYPFHYIHILSLLVFNSCLFHISCEN